MYLINYKIIIRLIRYSEVGICATSFLFYIFVSDKPDTMKKRIFCLLAAILALAPAFALGGSGYFEKLDSVIADSSKYIKKKHLRLAELKKRAGSTSEDSAMLRIYNELYKEYYTYKFDSAMAYVDKMAHLAARTGNRYYTDMASINRSVLLATGGMFSEAEANLRSIDEQELDMGLRLEFCMAYIWTYGYWSEFANGSPYAAGYKEKKKVFMRKALGYTSADAPIYHYLKGELLYEERRFGESYAAYAKALESLRVDTRLYAMVTYAMGRAMLIKGDRDGYERFMAMAAISDIVCQLKENLAIQEIAMYLYKNSPGEIKRAHNYINISLGDALFYRNRLRIIEIGNKLPFIVSEYQKRNDEKAARLRVMLVCISLLSAGLLVSLLFIRKQLRLSRRQRRELSESNGLTSELNRKLVQTNNIRENNMRLFLDLCATYIDKLNKYRNFVKRKVKARQVDDILKETNSSRLTENEATAFFLRFDEAFLELYPDFIRQFNSLLREDAQIKPTSSGSMTTGLRIFALIRLGIKDSSEIATLLSYSPQTIYNYRSMIKNGALNRETFEDDVAKLCMLA